MSLFCTILVLEKSFSKESAIFCIAANWASISVRWEENQAVEGSDEVRGGATIWFLTALQISDFTSSVVMLSETWLGSMWLSDGDSLATPSDQKRKMVKFQHRPTSLRHVQKTVVIFNRNTCVRNGLREISWNWKAGLWLRSGSCTLNNRCCEQMKLGWGRRGSINGSELRCSGAGVMGWQILM